MLSNRNTRLTWLVAIASIVTVFLYFSSPHISRTVASISAQLTNGSHGKTSDPSSTLPAALVNSQSKYAYVTLLGKDALHNSSEIDKDMYFASMRTLGWSLLHAKESKSNGIPFVVLAVPGVNPAKIARLEKDGAIVVHVEPIPLPDWLPVNLHVEWQDVWAKLRLFELVQFEKVIFLDADIIVAGPLDPVFEATLTQTTNKDKAVEIDHPSTIPDDYVFCAGIETSVNHHFPPTDPELEKGQYINAGFMIARPSIAMLNHLLAVLNIPNSFTTILLEQDLLNRVHRKDGAMPFQQLNWKFNAYRPTADDVAGGALSYHAKFWNLDHKDLTPYMESFRWKAMGYYEAQDQRSQP